MNRIAGTSKKCSLINFEVVSSRFGDRKVGLEAITICEYLFAVQIAGESGGKDECRKSTQGLQLFSHV